MIKVDNKLLLQLHRLVRIYQSQMIPLLVTTWTVQKTRSLTMAVTRSNLCLKVVSFNMRGFHQGCSVIDDLISNNKPDLFMLQEHWLTPANLCYFDTSFPDYFSVGSSAMTNCVAQGMLRGRPFGGTIILIKNELCKETRTIHCDERYVIVKVANYIFVNVYLPCVGVMMMLILYYYYYYYYYYCY